MIQTDPFYFSNLESKISDKASKSSVYTLESRIERVERRVYGCKGLLDVVHDLKRLCDNLQAQLDELKANGRAR